MGLLEPYWERFHPGGVTRLVPIILGWNQETPCGSFGRYDTVFAENGKVRPPCIASSGEFQRSTRSPKRQRDVVSRQMDGFPRPIDVVSPLVAE